MTLDEAIKLNTTAVSYMANSWEPSFLEAQRLGIEALKRIKELRSVPLIYTQRLLLGETEN